MKHELKGDKIAMYYNGKAPCYGCENRKPKCHDTCPKYIEWKRECDKKKEAAQLYYQGERDAERYQINELIKGKIIKHKKKK